MESKLSNKKNILVWILQLIAAIIMFQTLFFKFSAAKESIYIFSKIGMEPWGRIGTGVAELVASVFLLIPGLAWLGAFMGIGLMSGALFFHLTILGIEVLNDGGYLFILCLIVFISSAIVLYLRRNQIPYIHKFIYPVN